LDPSMALVHSPRTSLRPSRSMATATYGAVFHPPFVPHLHYQRVQKRNRLVVPAGGAATPSLPSTTASATEEIKDGDTSTP
jgi:hypothetical protein